MTFTEAVRTCFSKYFTFSGRASRPEYWWFVLFLLVARTICNWLDGTIYGDELIQTHVIDDQTYATIETTGPVESAFGLLTLLPFLTAMWRRMHDTGRSGLYALLPILLMIGAFSVLIFGIGLASSFQHGGNLDILFTRATLLIVIPTLLVLFVSPLLVLWWLSRPSQPGTNKYGPNPYEVAQ